MLVVPVARAVFLLLIVTLLLGEKFLEACYELVLVVNATLCLVHSGTFLLCFGLISLVTNLLIFGTKIITS